jgi:hypothetical protein
MRTLVCFLVLFFAIATTGFSQATPPTDYYVGKWEILVESTPMGDVKLLADLVRKDGKLTGELTNTADNSKPKVTNVVENGDKLTITFESSQVGEVSLELAKTADDDTMKGAIMSFSATAKRMSKP